MTAAAVQPETESPVKALARRPSQVTLLRPIAPAADVIVAQNETRELIAKALEKKRDYGEIPGTNKPTLFKAGAERVALAFGCFAQFRTLESEIDHDRAVTYIKKTKKWNNKHKGDKSFTWQEESGKSLGLYRYVVECQIVDRQTGDVVGSFMGSCSSMESKYIDRPRDVENTIIKMAEKRALVGAVLTTFGLSDQFTQDVEDLPREVVQNGQSANAPGDVQEAEAEVVKDLAWARAFPLPWPNHKHYKEPIEKRTTEELEKALVWAKNKINAAGAEGRELAPTDMLVEFRDALAMVIEDKKATAEKDQTKLDLAPTTAPSESTSVKMPPPGKVEDAIKEDPTSKRALVARIKKVLSHPAISVEERDAYNADNVNGFKKRALTWWVNRFELLVEKATANVAPTKEGADDFPAAMTDSPDGDGLPF